MSVACATSAAEGRSPMPDSPFAPTPRQEIALTTPDGKFTLKLRVSTRSTFALSVSAELLDQNGNPMPTSGESNLAYWSIQQGTLLRLG